MVPWASKALALAAVFAAGLALALGGCGEDDDGNGVTTRGGATAVTTDGRLTNGTTTNGETETTETDGDDRY